MALQRNLCPAPSQVCTTIWLDPVYTHILASAISILIRAFRGVGVLPARCNHTAVHHEIIRRPVSTLSTHMATVPLVTESAHIHDVHIV